VWLVRHARDVSLVAFPIRIVRSVEEGRQMLGIPGRSVEALRILVVEEECSLGELFGFDHLLFLFLVIILIPFNHTE